MWSGCLHVVLLPSIKASDHLYVFGHTLLLENILIVLQLYQNCVVCLCAGCNLNLHRLLAKSILNAFRFIALAPFSAHTCQYSTHTLITVLSTKVINNSNLPFFGSHLSEKSPRISVEQFNILDVGVVKRHNSWS